ncbi:MAG: type I 3-dehydroquinate dehydratase [Deltaproteobacteria bacterium]|nr:type I 3-dehydroquinate dehydratase [Deltaproteobacteria bacterium]
MPPKLKLKAVELGKNPVIAGVVADNVVPATLRKAKKDGATLLELRVDTLKDRSCKALLNATGKLKEIKLPILLTIRSKAEGGRHTIDDTTRLELFKLLTPHTDAIDIELGSKKIIKDVKALAKKHNKKLIVSFHDFKATPSDTKLKKIISDARRAGADIVKIAAKAKTKNDLKRLAGLLIEEDNIIIIAMGPLGKSSRIFFPLLGSLITYGAIGCSKKARTAPGQMMTRHIRDALEKYT